MFYLVFEGGNQYNDSTNFLMKTIKNTEAAQSEVRDTMEYLIGEDLLDSDFDSTWEAETISNHQKQIEHYV